MCRNLSSKGENEQSKSPKAVFRNLHEAGFTMRFLFIEKVPIPLWP
jgi:hypothetical protein